MRQDTAARPILARRQNGNRPLGIQTD